jgi:N-acetylglutamate synthase-like GNAT family acetyltransferase
MRHKGVATALLQSYISTIWETQSHIEKIALLTKFESGGLYLKCGFKMVGPSQVQHGKEQWFEMIQIRK